MIDSRSLFVLRRVGAVAGIEFRRLLRSPTTFMLLLVVPAMQVLLFGYAIRPIGATVTVAIAAPNPVSAKRIADTLADFPDLKIIASSLKPGGAEMMVRAEGALIGIEVPEMRSFANPIVVQRPLRIVVDSTNAAMTASVVPRIETAYWRAIVIRADLESSGPGLQIKRLYNPDLRSDWTFLPSLIGVTIMISMIMLGSLTLAREREVGTWETMLMLPMSAFEVLLGKLLPYTVIGTIQGLTVLGVGVTLFDVPTRGSIVGLALLMPVFAGAHLALGYVISSRAATQLAAVQGAVAFYLPAMLLSGFLYPFDTLPDWARVIGTLFPLKHFIDAAQAATLRGGNMLQVLAAGAPILIFLAFVNTLAVSTHTRRLR